MNSQQIYEHKFEDGFSFIVKKCNLLLNTIKIQSMAFRKGNSGNPKGRPRGAQNKTTIDLRQWINKFIDDNREQIKEDWKSLASRDRIILFEKLLKYTLPTLQAMSVTADIFNKKDKIENMTDEELKAKLAQLEKAIEE